MRSGTGRAYVQVVGQDLGGGAGGGEAGVVLGDALVGQKLLRCPARVGQLPSDGAELLQGDSGREPRRESEEPKTRASRKSSSSQWKNQCDAGSTPALQNRLCWRISWFYNDAFSNQTGFLGYNCFSILVFICSRK